MSIFTYTWQGATGTGGAHTWASGSYDLYAETRHGYRMWSWADRQEGGKWHDGGSVDALPSEAKPAPLHMVPTGLLAELGLATPAPKTTRVVKMSGGDCNAVLKKEGQLVRCDEMVVGPLEWEAGERGTVFLADQREPITLVATRGRHRVGPIRN